MLPLRCFAAAAFCLRYVLPPIRLTVDMFCRQYILPCFAAITFWYVLPPLQFTMFCRHYILICFAAITFYHVLPPLHFTMFCRHDICHVLPTWHFAADKCGHQNVSPPIHFATVSIDTPCSCAIWCKSISVRWTSEECPPPPLPRRLDQSENCIIYRMRK